MGPLALGMVGIVCLAPVISKVLGPVIIPAFEALGADPAMFASILANDMGGYSLAVELAKSEQAGLLSGNIVASMLGCTLVFSIPVGLGLIEKEDQTFFSKGLLIGLITIPVGSILGGLMAGFPAVLVLKNIIPIIILSVLLVLGLKFIPDQMIKGCMLFGKFITIVIYIGLAAAAFEYLTGKVLIPGMAPDYGGNGGHCRNRNRTSWYLPVPHHCHQGAGPPAERTGAEDWIGCNQRGRAGIHPSQLSTCIHHDEGHEKEGIIVNTAWLVPATAALGDHLGFTAGVRPDMITPVVLGKITAGVLAIILALVICKNMDEPVDEAVEKAAKA